jgi:hypothetical protein
MARAKFDIVIEAVRYAPDGKIEMARAFKRRGPTYSDHVLISRENLFENIKAGKKCIIGQRKEFLGSSFVPEKSVQIVGDFITTNKTNAEKDYLENTPIF